PPPDFTLEAGQIVGELAFALHRPRTATLQCLAPTALLSFHYQQMRTVLHASPFAARVEGRMGHFLLGRVLKYVCQNVPYLVGKDGAGPLARLSEPWEYLHDQSELLTCSWKQDHGIECADERIRRAG